MRISQLKLIRYPIDILLGHLVVHISHVPRLIVLFTSDLPDDLQVGGQLLRCTLHGSLNAQNRNIRLNVHEGLEHKVLGFENEALFDLFNLGF